MNAEKFLELIKNECNAAGVKYLFSNSDKISYLGDENIQVSGYFDDIQNPPELACAIGKPVEKWFPILVHESSHMDQWLEKSPLWLAINKNGIFADKAIDEWLSGKDFSKEFIQDCIRTMQSVELDCEIRAVEKIKKLNLPIDINEYIKNANSYVYFYSVILETRKWCDTAPYEIHEIMSKMPDYFLNKVEDYYILPDGLLPLYSNGCYISD